MREKTPTALMMRTGVLIGHLGSGDDIDHARMASLADSRTGKNARHALIGMLRQSVFGRLAGYEDVKDAERLCYDPAMRWIVDGDHAHGGSIGRKDRPMPIGSFPPVAAASGDRQGRIASG